MMNLNVKLTLVALTLITQASLAEQFRRTDTEYCIRKYKNALNVDESEMRNLCALYPDKQLDCADGVLREFSARDARAAIKLCILQFSDPSARACALNKMRDVRSNGGNMDITGFISDCRSGSSSQMRPSQSPRRDSMSPGDLIQRHERAPVVRESAPVVRTPAPAAAAEPEMTKRNYDTSSIYVAPTGTLIGKVKKADFVREVAKWLNIQPGAIRAVDSENYFGILDSAIENMALSMGREVRLYKISFNANGSDIACTGTDFAPGENGTNKFLTLHECTVNRQFGALASKFGDLNYGFLKNINEKFLERMKKAESQWSGSGNINFRKDVSDYLVIGY